MAKHLLLLVISILHLIDLSVQEESDAFAFNFHTHDCCNGVAFVWNYQNYYDTCCGNFTINSQKEVCCKSEAGVYTTLPSKGEITESCCGGEWYDAKIHRCCKRTKLHERKEDERCCGLEVYNKNTQICCNNKVVSKEGKGCHAQCCGEEIYDFATEVCCADNKVIKKTSDFDGCCAGNPFDKRTSICCQGNIISRQDSGPEQLCCGTATYNSFTQICCNGTVHDAKSIFTECCGVDAYEKSDQICCENQLHPRQSLMTQCCKNQTYDFSTHFCCSGTVFALDDSCYEHCCSKDDYGYKTEYEDHFECVDGDTQVEAEKPETKKRRKRSSEKEE